MSQVNDHLQQFALTVQAIKKANTICILTGAGISAESGIPTFRDKQTGLWENYRAEDLANINAFNRDPKFVWSWYQWRRNLVKDKLPNPAHHALSKWLNSDTDKKIHLLTQNVDDLHEQAGSKPIHLHGNLWQNKCSVCDTPYEQDSTVKDYTDELLQCNKCDGCIRPDIVWFGEMLPVNAWQTAEMAATSCDVFISIGTSSIVYPAAGLANSAKQNGATIIEINPNPTTNHVVDIVLAEKAGQILPKLVTELLSEK